MVKLIIDKQEAALTEEQSFTVVKSNPQITKDSSYTFTITLSLGNRMNAKIFGPINRKDITIKQTKLSAQLIIDGRTILNGTALILTITDKEVEIQLIQKNFDLLDQWKDRIIDQIQIGKILDFDTWGHDNYQAGSMDLSEWHGEWNPEDWMVEMEIEKTWGIDVAKDTAYAEFFDPYEDPHYEPKTWKYKYDDMREVMEKVYNYDFSRKILFCPIKVEEAGADNPDGLTNWYVYKDIEQQAVPGWVNQNISQGWYWGYAPMLFLSTAINLIFTKIGFVITRNVFDTDPYLSRIVICNGNMTRFLNRTLPSWTVEQFINNISEFFNVVFEFNKETCKIINRSELADNGGIANSSVNKNIEDEISVLRSFKKDITTTETSKEEFNAEYQNYTYKLDGNEYNKWDSIPYICIEKCKFLECVSEEDLLQKAKENASRTDLILVLKNDWFIYTAGKLKVINIFRDRFWDQKDNMKELKIKPVDTFAKDVHGIKMLIMDNKGKNYSDDETYKVVMETGLEEKQFDLVDAVENGWNESTKNKILKIALWEELDRHATMINTGGDKWLKYNHGIDRNYSDSLALYAREIKATGTQRQGQIRYKMNIKYTFYFISETFPDVCNTFIINGKKYIAESIQCQINAKTHNKKYKGIFYELDS